MTRRGRRADKSGKMSRALNAQGSALKVPLEMSGQSSDTAQVWVPWAFQGHRSLGDSLHNLPGYFLSFLKLPFPYTPGFTPLHSTSPPSVKVSSIPLKSMSYLFEDRNAFSYARILSCLPLSLLLPLLHSIEPKLLIV